MAAALSGCSLMPSFLGGAPDRPKAAELAPNPSLIGVRQAWSARIGAVQFPLSAQVAGGSVVVASTDGTITAFDAASGREAWRGSAGSPLDAGVGSDGTVAAVVTRTGDLVALQAGQPLWRQKLGAQAYTAPLVAGGRVFVLAGDRSVSGFDGATGRKLWTQQRPGEPLVLRQGGVLLAVGDTLVAGQGGRLAGLDPLTGAIRWEAPIGTSRGSNDVERLVDLVGHVSRVGESVCARAFQAAVGCVDTARGALAWTKPANGADGLSGDDKNVFGAERDGKLVAWRRDNGERAWTVDRLMHRGLTAPLLIGRSVAVGDEAGFVHLLSREDGSLLNRLTTDGSGIAAAPVLAGNTLVVVTRNGGVFGFVPQ
ncbi:MAG TPA: outer membrane protein assembly factor BamB [Ramlibacter sp.]|nr:outer membrane protein assembly factor BamB [Ramlibacter sp.]